ncbi:MAG: large subunit ribosomal protein, partial [Solirubrobacteraceae bacterium]|nr:large subunit ribosomal protein [Solirubrobacteraceae bacterium]
KEQKTALVEEIAGQIQDSDAVFAVDYRGISVPQAAELRTRLRDADATYRVVKNSLTERAADKAGADAIRDLLDGPTALTFVRGDAALAAKALADFGRAEDLLEFKGGLMDGAEVSVDDIKAISRLPARDVLHAQLVGMTAAPLTGLVGGLNALIAGLALQLGQIAEQGLVSGEAEAEAPAEAEVAPEEPAEAEAEAPAPEAEEAPAEETPAEEAPADEAQESPAGADEETATEADAPAAAAENDDNAAEA